MFTTLRLHRFKSWKDTGEIRLAPITVFFGTNSSGKTSLLQSLLLLKQTAESTDRTRVLHLGDARSLIDLGTPEDIVFRHDRRAHLGFQLGWQPQPGDLPGGIAGDDARLRFDLEVALERRTFAPLVRSMRFEVDGRHVGLERQPSGTYDAVQRGFGLRKKRGRAFALPGPVRFYRFPDEFFAFHQNAEALSDLPLALERQLGRIRYVGPIRKPPERSYLWSGQAPEDVGREGENVVAALLAKKHAQATVPPRVRGRGRRAEPFEQAVAGWLQKLGIIASFEVRPLVRGGRQFEVWVRLSPGSPEVRLTDVGFGVSQVLPVLVQAFYAPPHSTMLFEQPELHLHPSAQGALADALIDASVRGRVQFIVESHSEHFLRRLQRRIAEEDIAPEHVAVYKCDVTEGASRLERLEVDAFGQITNWPQDFFGDEMGDLLAMTEAAAERATDEST